MLPLQPRQQKIYVTCLVERDGRVLLLRGSQYRDRASSETIGYFGLPRFTLGFGHNPTDLIVKELKAQFGQSIESISILGVHERTVDEQIQIVDLIYRATIERLGHDVVGRYVFASESELEKLMLPHELEILEDLLKRVRK